MASITVPVQGRARGPLRRLNILHDLPQVADLIETCFEATMDDEGQTYVQQMRNASQDRDFLAWAGRLVESASMPLGGYVWEEDGKIIGNVSLVFQVYHGRKLAMIANVATEPTYRRRGIGRALTERAMLGARQKAAKDIWLQVRDDNPGAIQMYENLGFETRARRTTYHARGGLPAKAEPAVERDYITLSRPRRHHWSTQREWLERSHPEELSWYSHWDWGRLGPGLGNMFYRLLVNFEIEQWAATAEDQLRAAVSWIPTSRAPNSLWLAAAPDSGRAVTTVLGEALRNRAHHRKLTLEYPAGQLGEEIRAAGFDAHRTLLWMRATGSENRRI